MKLINLTPHDIHIISNWTRFTLPASGAVARAVERFEAYSEMLTQGEYLSSKEPGEWRSHSDLPVEVRHLAYEGVEGLPAPVEDVGYVVSFLTALCAQTAGRTEDVYYPGAVIRDEAGRVIGCRSLYRLAARHPDPKRMIGEIVDHWRSGHPDVWPYAGLPATEAYVEAVTGKTLQQLGLARWQAEQATNG